jgi:hypothetical protein
VGELLLRDAILSCHAPLNQALVSFLLSNNAATPQRLPQALSLAVSMGDMPVVERLQAAGWTPDLRDTDGGNALEVAAYRAMAPLIHRWRSYLPGAPDPAGQTLFHHLCRADLWTGGAQAAMDTAMHLIRGGVDWQKPDNSGVHAADLCRYPDTVAAIDQAWKDHRSAKHRTALGKLAQQHAPASEPAPSPRPRRILQACSRRFWGLC